MAAFRACCETPNEQRLELNFPPPPTHPKGDAENVNRLCVKSIMCYCDGLFWIKIQISDILV